MLMLSVPLGRTPRAPQLNATQTRSDNADPSTQLSASGLWARDDRVNYGVSLARIGGGNALDVNGGYRGGRGQVAANLSRGPAIPRWALARRAGWCSTRVG